MNQLPILFVGHGSPMNAIEDNEFSRSWKDIGKMLPRPLAILCISAHWETRDGLAHNDFIEDRIEGILK